jgi:hypothetical protein
MKKILIIISLLFSINVFASDYNLTANDKILINKLSNKIQIILDKSSLETRKNLENKINQIQNKYKNNQKLNYIFEEIKKNTHLINYENEYLNHYKKYNINFEIIKNNWLKRHNQVRLEL